MVSETGTGLIFTKVITLYSEYATAEVLRELSRQHHKLGDTFVTIPIDKLIEVITKGDNSLEEFKKIIEANGGQHHALNTVTTAAPTTYTN